MFIEVEMYDPSGSVVGYCVATVDEDGVHSFQYPGREENVDVFPLPEGYTLNINIPVNRTYAVDQLPPIPRRRWWPFR